MSENNHNTGDDSDWLRHAIVGDKIRIAQLENEIKQLREKETALLAAGDKLEQQLVTVAQQRDALRLTDAEREAVQAAIDEWATERSHQIAAALRRVVMRHAKH